uniref:Neuropilin and tolloid-like protein 2 n=2 Tax=Hirondellea gigas TaxID=1518452 RepID=A0A6A7G1V8_9CRUS
MLQPSRTPTLRRHCCTTTMTFITVADVLLTLLLLLSGAADASQWPEPQLGYSGPLTMEQRCQAFSVANVEDKEFYSPLYTSKYPNNTDCTLHLEAEFGFIIRVDFRDYFEMEPSEDCENDFLEIRDGAHGYSDLMGRYCGGDFPPIITSKNRYLWLRFRSDETLEYKGFRAVYEYIVQEMGRPEIPPCHFETGGVTGLLSHTDIPQYRFNYSTTYRMPIDCTWTIRVNAGHKIYLFFEEFELAQPNECDVNFVDLFGEHRDLRSRIEHFCGSMGDSVITTTNTMHVRFYAVGQARQSKFKAWFTAFRDRIVEGVPEEQHVCYDTEYDCDDASCIDASLECNGVKNCRHEYDEEGCSDSDKMKFDIRSQHIIIILTMGCGLLGGMCFAMCFNCIRKLISDGRQIHENIRRSREQLEGGRPRSMVSIPSTASVPPRPPPMQPEDYISGHKPEGRTCVRVSSEESDEDDDIEDDLDELDEETSVEMRDCECQTRDSLTTQRDSSGQLTPPPPPPPTRRPPGVPPTMSHEQVPTPPPPPTHYARNHHALYEVQSDDDDSYKFRAHTIIHVPEKTSRTPSKAGKTTPDVLVTH